MNSRRRKSLILRKGGGVFLALGGLVLVVKTVPFFVLPLLLGSLLVLAGWHIYSYNPHCW